MSIVLLTPKMDIDWIEVHKSTSSRLLVNRWLMLGFWLSCAIR